MQLSSPVIHLALRVGLLLPLPLGPEIPQNGKKQKEEQKEELKKTNKQAQEFATARSQLDTPESRTPGRVINYCRL
jgi:hypothetical protein